VWRASVRRGEVLVVDLPAKHGRVYAVLGEDQPLGEFVSEAPQPATLVDQLWLEDSFLPVFAPFAGTPAPWVRLGRFRAHEWLHPPYVAVSDLESWPEQPVERHGDVQLLATVAEPLGSLPAPHRWAYTTAARWAVARARRLPRGADDTARVSVVHRLFEAWNFIADRFDYDSSWRPPLIDAGDRLARALGLPGGETSPQPLPKAVSCWGDWVRNF
jgi:hypothetical protein